MNALWVVAAAALAVPAMSVAYEKAFKSTDAGTIEIKEIPERTLIVARRGESYFEENNALFGQLFRYIKDNDVSMTVPVKADIDPGNMYFYVGSKDLAKDLRDTDSVKVVVEPVRQVLSIGVRGGYSENNFRKAREKLFEQLDASKDWKVTGEAYAIFWNGPYVPSFMKKFEVHVPIVPAVDDKEE
ncbi:heme-binding protein [Pontiellaceae bacterium B12227]|nr:heme-binding protein [Pontiellaceae bacterium B12227]